MSDWAFVEEGVQAAHSSTLETLRGNEFHRSRSLGLAADKDGVWTALSLRDGTSTLDLGECGPFDPDGVVADASSSGAGWVYDRAVVLHGEMDAVRYDEGDDLAEAHFRERYVRGARPAMIEGACEAWRAADAWRGSQFGRERGHIPFKFTELVAVHGFGAAMPVRAPLSLYAEYAASNGADAPWYLFGDDFADLRAEFLADFSAPRWFAPRRDVFEIVPGARARYRRHMYMVIGGERTGTNLHVDPAHTGAWNALLSGCKRWVLFPPGTDRAEVGAPSGPAARTYAPSRWWIEEYPRIVASGAASRLGMIEVLQRPGETIFVPAGWLHAVLNIRGLCVAVTQNTFDPCTVAAAWRGGSGSLAAGRGDPELTFLMAAALASNPDTELSREMREVWGDGDVVDEIVAFARAKGRLVAGGGGGSSQHEGAAPPHEAAGVLAERRRVVVFVDLDGVGGDGAGGDPKPANAAGFDENIVAALETAARAVDTTSRDTSRDGSAAGVPEVPEGPPRFVLCGRSRLTSATRDVISAASVAAGFGELAEWVSVSSGDDLGAAVLDFVLRHPRVDDDVPWTIIAPRDAVASIGDGANHGMFGPLLASRCVSWPDDNGTLRSWCSEILEPHIATCRMEAAEDE